MAEYEILNLSTFKYGSFLFDQCSLFSVGQSINKIDCSGVCEQILSGVGGANVC